MNSSFKKYIAEITQYMQDNGVDLYPFPSVMLNKKPQSDDLFINTGYYNPEDKVVVLFTHNRHPKDVLRSYAHELIHHNQNISGMMSPEKMGEGNDPKYAQNNPHLRSLEEDAYQRGNMMFRFYCDNKKYGK